MAARSRFGLTELRRVFVKHGCTRIYAKRLSQNDNSKQQVYLGGGFRAVGMIPTREVVAKPRPGGEPRFLARLDFAWVDPEGSLDPAPHAQLILYPQYPEVRFSGFLRGCQSDAGKLLRHRPGRDLPRRVLFFGVTATSSVLGLATRSESALGREFNSLTGLKRDGVFLEVPVGTSRSSRSTLLDELARIHRKRWIRGKRLDRAGNIIPYNAQNAAGFTLEAELGVRPNAEAAPDFLGWEVKQHKVARFDRLGVGKITVMTPEPKGGAYVDRGLEYFVKKYGYPDRSRPSDRMNFGGVHRYGHRVDRTGLTLSMIGYDHEAESIVDADGGVVLRAEDGAIAALWPYSNLIEHWAKKHAQAAYVPSRHKKAGAERSYYYGHRVRLGVGTDSLLLLRAIANGSIYYDPGIHVSGLSKGRPKGRKRSQFRIASADVPSLYRSATEVDLVTHRERALPDDA